MQKKSIQGLIAKNQELQARLQEALETLDAIRRGEVDGIVVSTPEGEQVYSISGAEKPYRFLIEEMREGAAMLSDDNTILYCNRGFAKIVNCPLERIVGVNIERLISPTHKAAFKELLLSRKAAVEQGAATKGITLIADDASLVPTQMSVNSMEMDKTTTTFIVVTDLTEHMEEELKKYTSDLEKAGIALFESEQRWSTTLASIGDAVIATDVTGKITFMNSIAEALTGWTLDEASQRSVHEVFKIINEKTRQEVEDPIAKVIEKGLIVGLGNHTILLRKDGTEIPIDDSGALIRAKDGKVSGVVLIFRDITERRKAEDTLRTSERRFKSLAENAPDVIMRFDTDLRVIYLNPKVETVTGISPKRFIGKTNEEMNMPEDLVKMWNELFRKARDSKQAQQVEFVFSSPGEDKSFDLRVVPEYGEDGALTSFLGISRDITERKKVEEALGQAQAKLQDYARNLEHLVEERTKQLKDAERMAAIGQTAGMVGHDIRNPLQSIVGELYLARGELTSMPEGSRKNNMIESLANIENEVNYISKIVQDLQDFAKPLSPCAEETDLSAIVEGLTGQNAFPKNVEPVIEVEKEARKVMTDSAYVKRILGNLVNNAVQAMPNGGTLKIQVYRERDDLILTVEDTGIGIPESAKAMLFKPLFTTKSKGQGFGLAVVKRMTEALGGIVKFESEIGKGTKFIVRLPAQKNKQ